MHSDLPKVLHPHRRQAAAGPRRRHRAQLRRRAASASSTATAASGCAKRCRAATSPGRKQEPQLGTGHAVLQALPHLDATVPTLVLYGDVPLTRVDTLRRLLRTGAARDGSAGPADRAPRQSARLWPHRPRRRRPSCASSKRRMPTTPSAQINEINTGILVAPTAALTRWLPGLAQPQRPGRVLPHRHRRPGRRRRHGGALGASAARLGSPKA